MCDIPFGSFICIYTGVIRKEDDAETNGRVIGDEYFANLNFIESGEATKAQWFWIFQLSDRFGCYTVHFFQKYYTLIIKRVK